MHENLIFISDHIFIFFFNHSKTFGLVQCCPTGPLSLQPGWSRASTTWIEFVGSYAGSLSAWIRLRFPHPVTVSVSSSGLLLTKLDYKENPQVVAEALTTTDHDCNLVVSQVINTLELEETLGQRGKNKHL